jgi:cell division protein FtsW
MTTLSPPLATAREGRGRVRGRRLALAGEATGTFWLIAAVVTVLNMVGLVMVMSASSVTSLRETGSTWTYFERQAAWTVLGVVALFVFLAVDVGFWRRHARVWLIGSFGLLVLVLVPGIGVNVNGATRWLGYGPVQVQPSELVKFALLIWVADLLDRRRDHMGDLAWTLYPVLAYLGAAAGLIMLQPNLGTTIIIATMVMAMLWAAGTPAAPLTLTGLAGAALAAYSVASTPFRRRRFFAFLDPMKDPGNTGYQTVQSMVGLADGGLFGKGLGASRAKWGFLPYAHTDFIFAIIGEEFGLLGAIMVVVLFGALGLLGLLVAARARDRFSLLVAIGITAWLMVQTAVNIGAVIGLMPTTGVPLPFVSFGGTALVVNLAATGMLLNIARHPVEPAPRPDRDRTARRRAASAG